MGVRIHQVKEIDHRTHQRGVISAVPGPNEWSASRPEKDIGLAKSSAKQTGQMDLFWHINRKGTGHPMPSAEFPRQIGGGAVPVMRCVPRKSLFFTVQKAA
jgi:hypothetical protein